jgi:hypothetical protein
MTKIILIYVYVRSHAARVLHHKRKLTWPETRGSFSSVSGGHDKDWLYQRYAQPGARWPLNAVHIQIGSNVACPIWISRSGPTWANYAWAMYLIIVHIRILAATNFPIYILYTKNYTHSHGSFFPSTIHARFRLYNFIFLCVLFMPSLHCSFESRKLLSKVLLDWSFPALILNIIKSCFRIILVLLVDREIMW